MTGKENPHGGQSERVRKVMRLINTALDGRVKVRVSYSRGYGEQKNAGEKIEVAATSYPLYIAALAAIRKERRRRRHTGGEAFEFRVTLREG